MSNAKDTEKVCELLNDTYNGEPAERERIFIIADYFGWDVDEDNEGMLVIYTNQKGEGR